MHIEAGVESEFFAKVFNRYADKYNMPATIGPKKAKSLKKIPKKQDDPKVSHRRRTRSPRKGRDRQVMASFVKRLRSLFAMLKTSRFLKTLIMKPTRQAHPKKRYQEQGIVRKTLTTMFIAPMLLILV